MKKQKKDKNNCSVFLTIHSVFSLNERVIRPSATNVLKYYGDPDTTKTKAVVVENPDCFLDCLDVRCTREGILKNKPDRHPYTLMITGVKIFYMCALENYLIHIVNSLTEMTPLL